MIGKKMFNSNLGSKSLGGATKIKMPPAGCISYGNFSLGRCSLLQASLKDSLDVSSSYCRDCKGAKTIAIHKKGALSSLAGFLKKWAHSFIMRFRH
jgi:hypothetical protein